MPPDALQHFAIDRVDADRDVMHAGEDVDFIVGEYLGKFDVIRTPMPRSKKSRQWPECASIVVSP